LTRRFSAANRWKWLPGDGGIAKGTRESFNVKNGIFIGSVGIVNYVNFIIESKPYLEILTHQAPFVILGALFIIFRNKISRKVTAILFSLLGILTALQGLEDNTGGMVFFIYGFYIFRKTWLIIVTLSLTAVAILVKSTILGFSIAESYNLIILHIWAMVIYFDLFVKKYPEVKPTIIIRPDLKPIHVLILQKLYQGYIYKQIGWDVNLKEGAVQGQIKRLKKKFNVQTTQELKVKCLEMGVLDMKVDTRDI
jgi:hypothetical protein